MTGIIATLRVPPRNASARERHAFNCRLERARASPRVVGIVLEDSTPGAEVSSTIDISAYLHFPGIDAGRVLFNVGTVTDKRNPNHED
jgi:hypothetical protein